MRRGFYISGFIWSIDVRIVEMVSSITTSNVHETQIECLLHTRAAVKIRV